MDRAQLLTETAEELNRQDKAHLLPTWLRSAEFRLNNLLRTRDMVTRAILQVTELVFPGPPDMLAPESMSIQSGTINGVPSTRKGTLFYVPAPELENDTDDNFLTDHPHWFTVRGKYIELVGWSGDADFQVQLYYYAELPVLDTDEKTNWLLDKAPHIYKNAILAFGHQHLEEYATAERMLQMVAAECEAMNQRSEEMKYGTGPLIRRANGLRFGGRHS